MTSIAPLPGKQSRCEVLTVNGQVGVRLVLPSGLVLLSANDRLHHMEEYRRKKAIKDAAFLLVKARNAPQMPRANVNAFIHPGPRTPFFDPHNWAPSVKAAIDGAVKAGLLPDDSSAYLPETRFLAGDRLKAWQIELVFIPVPEAGTTT